MSVHRGGDTPASSLRQAGGIRKADGGRDEAGGDEEEEEHGAAGYARPPAREVSPDRTPAPAAPAGSSSRQAAPGGPQAELRLAPALELFAAGIGFPEIRSND